MDEKIELDGTATIFFELKKGYEPRSKLSYITNNLKLYEKLSVIFLLCRNSHEGLEIMRLIFQESDITAQNNLFYKWMRKQSLFTNPKWSTSFAEVLTIIQNYKLAKIFGFSKTELIKKFMPKNNFQNWSISGIRKVLYNLCENLVQDEFDQLIEIINNNYKINISIINKSQKCLEFYLLYWSEKKLIMFCEEEKVNLNVLITSLKSLGLNNLGHEIEVLVEKFNCLLVRNKSCSMLDIGLLEYYEVIDEKNLGFCVVISEENFSKCSFRKRKGTDKDVQRLIEVFTSFGFIVKIHEDLTYEQFINTLANYAKTVDENFSFFVLVILSHGSENVIYTSDSIQIDMDTIEMMFQAEVCPKLIGKPKIFIVQACQGEKYQKVLVKDNETEIVGDNFVLCTTKQSKTIGPQKGDSIIAWSTVQGFASFRDIYNGSWYIEELCKELWKYGDTFHLVEIFTRVNNNLRNKVYNGQFMVPNLYLSLRANVKFPQVKEHVLKGKKLMLERLIFEKYFKEFVINYGVKKLLNLLF